MPDPYSFSTLEMIESRILSVIGTVSPFSSIARVQRCTTDSGAPFTSSVPFLPALPLGITTTPIDLRSRENSRIVSRESSASQRSLQGVLDPEARPPTLPSFSTSTLSAASVDSPMRSHTPLSLSAMFERLHIDITLLSSVSSAVVETFLPARVTSPLGSYVMPSTSSSTWSEADLPKKRIFCTDIWLVVSVPVLSEQITEQHPSVSTAGRCRMSALRFAMRRVPSARHVVTTAGSPSGMAATASATASLK
mmetsp:Transcript_33816/g.80058  ORF Transcript_33816/g.80058 Transcript_33816/m.80058 type:complete len:251 (-) Transcript_33816:1125-1877(-)